MNTPAFPAENSVPEVFDYADENNKIMEPWRLEAYDFLRGFTTSTQTLISTLPTTHSGQIFIYEREIVRYLRLQWSDFND
jgi:hypothetical protein